MTTFQSIISPAIPGAAPPTSAGFFYSGPTGYANTSITLTTNGTTAAGSAVLNFSSTAGVAIGMSVNLFDGTSTTNIPPNTTVLSFTSTTVTLSNTVVGSGIATSTSIVFTTAASARPTLRQMVLNDLASTVYAQYTISSSTSVTISNPCPSNVIATFTATSQSITLPAMNASNSPPIGFVFNVTNSSTTNSFSILSSNSTTITTVPAGFSVQLILNSTTADSGGGGWTLSLQIPASTSQNYVVAGPTSGSGVPTMRALVAGDIPALSALSGSVTLSQLPTLSAYNIYANNTASTATPTSVSISTALDMIGAGTPPAQGSVLYRGSSTWATLAPTTSGYVLATQGASANPVWFNLGSLTLNSFSAPTANIPMNNFTFTGMSNPLNAQDAATKSYVDNLVVSGSHGYGEAFVLYKTGNVSVTSAPAASTFTDGSTTPAGFTTTTTASTLPSSTHPDYITVASTTGYTVGMSVSGTGVPAGAIIITIISGTQFQMNEQVSEGGVANGATITVGNIILLTAQSTASQNGLWIYPGSGNAMVRPSGVFTSGSTINNGFFVYIGNGTTYGGTGWIMSATSSGTYVVVDTTGQSWTQFSGNGSNYITSVSTSGAPTLVVSSGQLSVQAASYTVLGNATGSTTTVSGLTTSQVLDNIGSGTAPAQGTILYRGASGWSQLAPGSNGYALITGGTGANPSWAAVSTITNQNANTFYAGPISGSATSPAFRNIGSPDLVDAYGVSSITASNTYTNNSTYGGFSQTITAAMASASQTVTFAAMNAGTSIPPGWTISVYNTGSNPFALNASGGTTLVSAIPNGYGVQATLLTNSTAAGTFQLSANIPVSTSQYFVLAGPSTGSGFPQFRALVAGDIPSLSSLNGSVTLTQLPTLSPYNIYANNTNSTTTPTSVSISTALDMVGAGTAPSNGAILWRSAGTWTSLVVGATSIVGNSTGTTGTVQNITLASTLAFSGTTLTLAAVGTAGTYGSANLIPATTYNAYGQETAVTYNSPVTFAEAVLYGSL